MKNVLIVGLLVMFVIGFSVVGCEEKSDTPDVTCAIEAAGDAVDAAVREVKCDKCGEIKGSEACCVVKK